MATLTYLVLPPSSECSMKASNFEKVLEIVFLSQMQELDDVIS